MNTRILLVAGALAVWPAGAQGQQAFTDNPPPRAKRFLLYEDFERVRPGGIPRGFQKRGDVGVVQGVAHTGRNSLRIEPATNGPRRIAVKGQAITALGGSHWGRLFFRVELPAPAPPGSGVIHSTLVAGTAQSPLHKDPIEVRFVDTIYRTDGTFHYIYNVQPRGRGEFAEGGGPNHKFTDQWTLAEWYVDHATQSYRLFINGKEQKGLSFRKGKGKYEKCEIPEVFESISFGWWNYQAAGKGFTVWIDDIALAKERIGAIGIRKRKR